MPACVLISLTSYMILIYIGVNCETPVDHCKEAPCQNQGVCSNSQTDFSCQCTEGYTGETCDLNIDECLKSPCQNEAVCIDLPGSYRSVLCTTLDVEMSLTTVKGWPEKNCVVQKRCNCIKEHLKLITVYDVCLRSENGTVLSLIKTI